MTAQHIRVLLFVGLAALSFAQTALTNDSIIRMVKDGQGGEVVILDIQVQPANYSTGESDLKALKEAGVSQKIIAAMLMKANGRAPSTSGNGLAGAPDGEPGPEPELRRTVFWLDPGNGKLNELERQDGQRAVTGTNPLNPGHIFKGPKGVMEIEGKRSPVRFPSGSKPEFIFRAAQNSDIQTFGKIHTFTVKKRTRELTTLKLGGPFSNRSRLGEDNADTVPFQASRYDKYSFRIVPATPLAPGEYGISLGAAPIFFCFGVD